MSKFRYPGSRLLFSLVVAALMFSPQVTQIPTYMVVSGMHLTNTYWAMILPKLSTAMYLFLAKQFMDQIPDTYIESARIDGAGESTIFIRIILPMIKPALMTVVVFSFTAFWNDFFSPMVYTTTEEMKTLPLALQTIGTNVMRAGASNAASFLMTDAHHCGVRNHAEAGHGNHDLFRNQGLTAFERKSVCYPCICMAGMERRGATCA